MLETNLIKKLVFEIYKLAVFTVVAQSMVQVPLYHQ